MGPLFRRVSAFCGLSVLAGGLSAGAVAQTPSAPWEIRGVVLTTYEIGKDKGDRAGEFQPWVEGEKLTETLPFPAGVHNIYTDKSHHILYLVTGTTLAPMSATVMALGMDPRFDLRKAYWILSGIAGFDQTVASVGSVSWADYVFSDISKYIDPREAPADWPYGFYLMTAQKPDQYILSGGEGPDGSIDHPMTYRLNPALVQWAWQLTHNMPLADSPALAAERKRRSAPAAKQLPSVVIGGDFAADTFWHGAIMTQFARNWVKMLSRGQTHFTESNMEDAGMVEALGRLTRAGKADVSRVLISRSASNYTEQPPGQTAVQSANDSFSGETQALENGYRVASKVLHEITDHWDRFRDGVH